MGGRRDYPLRKILARRRRVTPTTAAHRGGFTPTAHNALSGTTRHRRFAPSRCPPATITTPQGRAQTLKNKINTRLSAQCYPRHACPLYGSVLMQVHEHAGGAPALAALRCDRGGKRMRFDAVMHAGLKMAKNTEKTHKKTGTQDASFFTLRKGDITQDSPIM